MHTKIALVLVQSLKSGDIGGSFHHLVHPLDGTHHFVPLLLCEHWRTLVLRNFFICMDSHNQHIAQCFCLSQRICVTEMYHIITGNRNQYHTVIPRRNYLENSILCTQRLRAEIVRADCRMLCNYLFYIRCCNSFTSIYESISIITGENH